MTTMNGLVSSNHPGKVGDIDGALEARILSCAACHGDENVLSQDDFGDVGFCRECLEQVRTRVPYADLGGEC